MAGSSILSRLARAERALEGEEEREGADPLEVALNALPPELRPPNLLEARGLATWGVHGEEPHPHRRVPDGAPASEKRREVDAWIEATARRNEAEGIATREGPSVIPPPERVELPPAPDHEVYAKSAPGLYARPGTARTSPLAWRGSPGVGGGAALHQPGTGDGPEPLPAARPKEIGRSVPLDPEELRAALRRR